MSGEREGRERGGLDQRKREWMIRGGEEKGEGSWGEEPGRIEWRENGRKRRECEEGMNRIKERGRE